MRMIVDGRGHYFPGDNSFPTLARQLDHDLRSPLMAICSHADCLAWLPLEPDARQACAKTIAAQARRLGRLSAGFLVLAAPPLSEQLEELDAAEAVDEALRELEDLIELQGQEVNWLRTAPLPLVWPRAVLQQLLVAALEAALEAARGERRVSVRLEQAEREGVELVVEGGPGQPTRVRESFPCRAAELLAEQRGGIFNLQTEGQVRLSLRLPRVGLVGAVPEGRMEKIA